MKKPEKILPQDLQVLDKQALIEILINQNKDLQELQEMKERLKKEIYGRKAKGC